MQPSPRQSHSQLSQQLPPYPQSPRTTNRHDYRPYNVSPPPSRRSPSHRTYQATHYDPDVLNTTYKTNYVKQQIEPSSRSPSPNSKSQRREYQPSPHRLEGQSEYKAKYEKKPLPTSNSSSAYRNYKPHYQPRSIKFEGESTYNSDFVPKTSPSPSRRSPSPPYKPSKAAFDGTTTYQKDYVPKCTLEQSPPRRSSSPYSPSRAVYSPSKSRFEGETSYNSDYQPKELHERSKFGRTYQSFGRSPNKI